VQNPRRATTFSIADFERAKMLLSIERQPRIPQEKVVKNPQLADLNKVQQPAACVLRLINLSGGATASMASVKNVEVVTFQKSWLIRIGASLVVFTTTLLLLLSILAFGLHFHGPFAAVALYSYLAGSMGMILLCVGAVLVLMRRRPVE